MLTLFLACADPGADSQQPDDSGSGADEFSRFLRSTTDLCAYEDGEVVDAELLPTPKGHISLYPPVYVPCLDGGASVMRRVLDHPEGRLELADAFATFFTVDVADQSWMEGEWLDGLSGTDDCGLARTTYSGLANVPKIVWLDPGAVDLDTPEGAMSMNRREGGSVLNWELDLTKVIASDEEFSYGLAVGSSAGTGKWGPFDAIDLPDLVTLPSRLEVTSPTPLGPGVALSRKDAALEWTGASDGLVSIKLAGDDKKHIFELRCTATDDGAFTIPGKLIDLLPSDLEVTLTVSRVNDVWAGTTHGRSFHARGFSFYEAWDLTVP